MKTIKIGEFIDRLRKRLEADNNPDALLFFQVFLQGSLISKLQKEDGAPSNWHELDLSARQFDDVYPYAADILRNAASRNFSEHSDTYKAAHAVSVAFCQELNQLFGFTGQDVYDLIPIQSYVEMMIQAGLVKSEDGNVRLTPEGEKAAQSVEREIKGG